MYNPSFKSATLPPVLLALSKQLQRASSPDANRDAAHKIMMGYFGLFNQAAIRQQLWTMLAGCMSSKMKHLQKVEACQDLIFFYEFTLLFMQASQWLQEEENN